MTEQWFYAWRGEKLGPFSGEQLQELAESGKIQPTDTIWKDGVDEGVPAARVNNLFAAEPVTSSEHPKAPDAVGLPVLSTLTAESAEGGSTPAIAAPSETAPSRPRKPKSDSGLSTLASEEQTSETKPAAKLNPPEPPKVKRGQAMAVRGAVIVSQDGMSVQYRKKCIKCGHEEASKNRMPIRNGVTRQTYFCPKCRKVMPVEIQGTGK